MEKIEMISDYVTKHYTWRGVEVNHSDKIIITKSDNKKFLSIKIIKSDGTPDFWVDIWGDWDNENNTIKEVNVECVNF